MPSNLNAEDFSTKKEKYICMPTDAFIGLYLKNDKFYKKNKPFILPQVREQPSQQETPMLDLDTIAFTKEILYQDDESSVHNQ
eukprot:14641493-Ditylum_brightwellii.AAC.1